MGLTVTEKIIADHLVEGEMTPGSPIALRIDQTLTQDATGTMAYLEFEAIGLDRVRTELSVSYVDHNLLQSDFRNADDHRFLQSIAARYGVHFSRPGNGICHQVHFERFAVPGKTLLGSDSHTPTAGGCGMLAMGAGGLDVAMAMAGQPFHLRMPEVVGVRLVGALRPWVSAKDVILELLRRLTVKGGVGKVMEYFGPGLSGLSATDRAAIANLGTELGATGTVFPSDEVTRAFLAAQDRERDWRPLAADPDADYAEVIEVDLSALEPMVACPSSPDNVVPVREVAGRPVAQVLVGSCANSSLRDIAVVARALEGRTVHEWVSLEVNPGSRQVLENADAEGHLRTLIHAGARIQQCGCLGCIGMGQAPPTGGVSLRTFTRNFPGRSGTKDDQVYLCSPETAVAAAIRGVITDPRELGAAPEIRLPARYIINDAGILPPPADGSGVEVLRGPNIRPLPEFDVLPEDLDLEVLLKVGDNITTDHIMPAGSRVLPLRSNVPAISRFVFESVDPSFAERAERAGGGIVVGGDNYGQGSSREHAALAPRYLGVRAKLAKGFARIHKANLVNFGIVPMTFADPADYDRVRQGDRLAIPGLRRALLAGAETVTVRLGGGGTFDVRLDLGERDRRILAEGSLLGWVRARLAAEAG
ncbi:aconitate hydratase [Dissulfurirhabdus thermomarina]|uniref:Aconitate hydratase n=1 Tax=Dissulfurirhabdus thermomarina TaxID=1765737 RepID=A0A6N9TSX5_DISTH|nr:aconitate hydratase [Dissulfurirhabdus thermomarina]NDY43500.1 aconitate hydratase [Dissulfurirhabdus thermomarina]NMX24392.1 aconitate hydratase [Dissulfurirhabdus thermomarina]